MGDEAAYSSRRPSGSMANALDHRRIPGQRDGGRAVERVAVDAHPAPMDAGEDHGVVEDGDRRVADRDAVHRDLAVAEAAGAPFRQVEQPRHGESGVAAGLVADDQQLRAVAGEAGQLPAALPVRQASNRRRRRPDRRRIDVAVGRAGQVHEPQIPPAEPLLVRLPSRGDHRVAAVGTHRRFRHRPGPLGQLLRRAAVESHEEQLVDPVVDPAPAVRPVPRRRDPPRLGPLGQLLPAEAPLLDRTQRGDHQQARRIGQPHR